ncbi:MAG TPA: hypothetical protein PK629_12370 [Oscillospiraceae bacterium]|nr:hypothetical protein [Oscillospiraceae bacterium]HPF56432.1 hypothetical protein [Clostridiales bacterium]HPK36568.1 hypothetical protein [Oscillospiraceae bacterium]HPR76763.1 hypothetical protein [Oscillospiraceae bacterium]
MTKKKRNIIIALILAILLILGSALFYLCYEKPYIFKITIHPSGGSSGSYYFILYNDNTLYCSEGEMRSYKPESIKSKMYLWFIDRSDEKKLTDQEVENLLVLAKEIEANGNDYPVKNALDTWHVALYYNRKIYETDYSAVTNEKLKELINEIIALSAIDTDVYTRGFA